MARKCSLFWRTLLGGGRCRGRLVRRLFAFPAAAALILARVRVVSRCLRAALPLRLVGTVSTRSYGGRLRRGCRTGRGATALCCHIGFHFCARLQDREALRLHPSA